MNGQRGRKRAAIEHPDAETRNEDLKVRCRLCLEYVDYGVEKESSWMSLHNFKKSHLASKRHQESIKANERAAEAEVPVAQTEPGPFVQSNPITVSSIPTQRTEENAYIPEQDTEMDLLMRDFHGDFEMENGPKEILRDREASFMNEALEHNEWSGIGATLHSAGADALEDDENEAYLTELLKNIDLDKSAQKSTGSLADWAPYPSKTVFLLDIVDNLPRNRISGGFMKILLWLLSELGVDEVPSFDKLRAIQKAVRDEKGVQTIDSKTPKGQAHSFNDLRTLVANDWSNPLVRPHIRRYPVIPKDGVISEIWHAEKWRQDIDRTCLSPMYDAGGGSHYYIDELALCRDGSLVVPVRWLEDETGSVWCEAWTVYTDGASGTASIDNSRVVLVKAVDLQKDFPTLQDECAVPESWSSETVSQGLTQRMPNPDRALAAGDAIYSSFVDIFGDDVSGNRSKSWNKHWNIYMSHRNLPRKLLFQTFHTHFISTSTHASVPEQFHSIKSVIDETHKNPITTRDALTGRSIKIKIFCNCGPGDNPSQSETSGHIGGNGNFPCRKCEVGGTQQEKQTDSGFHQLFSPGNARSATANIAAIEAQLAAACTGVAQTVKDLQSSTGIKDLYMQHWIDDLIERARHLRRLEPSRPHEEIKSELLQWVDDNRSTIYNPFLTLKGFDAPIDTPVEILHTILLGVVKYVWRGSYVSWNKTQKATFVQRLRATNTSALNVPSIRSSYIMQYANSLNGRQLKLLAQVNAFHIYDLVEDVQFKLAKAVGELAALLWIPEIHNLDEYLNDVETAAANVLDIAAELDPSKMVSKIKYHLLAHLRQDITRFGPLVGVATETFECFNAIFRFCSILSNHIAPSRDIAHQLAEQETLKHLLSGGWWYSKDTHTWERGGTQVRQYIDRHPPIRKLLGWTESDIDSTSTPAGSIVLQPVDRKKSGGVRTRKALAWNETEGCGTLNPPASLTENLSLMWYQGKYVVAQSRDKCECGSWIYADSPFSTDTIVRPPISGRIVAILQDTSAKISLVVVDLFDLRSTRDGVFDMPVLARSFNETRTVAIGAKSVLFSFNVQHDCKSAGCVASGERIVRQERTDTANTELVIEHKPVEQYLVNLHAFHNAHLLRRVLPRDLTTPIPYVEDRISHHHTQAAKLRHTKASKQAEAAAKKAAGKEGADSRDGNPGQRKRRREDGDRAEREHMSEQTELEIVMWDVNQM